MEQVMFTKFKEKTKVSRTIRKVVIQQKKNRHEKIQVYFLCQYIQGWNKIENVYREMEKSELIDVHMLAIPDDISKFPENPEFEFWKKQDPKAINAVQNGKWYDLHAANPDYVFIQRPYNNYLPIEYHTTTIYQYAKLCYIPYGYLLANIRSVVSPPEFAELVYMFFSENIYEKKYLDECHPNMKLFHIKKNLSLGYPALDIKSDDEKGISAFERIKNKESLYKIIWTPRWTTDEKLLGTNFFKYKDEFVKFIQERKEFGGVFRPHPLAFQNFIQTGKMKEQEVESYLKNFTERLVYDKTSLYYKTFEESDCLITDFSSIIVEYLATEKPIIFCHEDDSMLNETMLEISKGCYRANTWEEIVKYLEMLNNNIDPLRETRKELAEKLIGRGKRRVVKR